MASIADIVNHYIVAGTSHFGGQPQTADDWLADWGPTQDRYPWLVAERDGVVGGIAYAKPWNVRAAYGWTAETTIYLCHGLGGQGIGTALYRRLLELLEAQGYRLALAVIALPNDASVALHERFGYRPAGRFDRVGFKLGVWRDVGYWQRPLGSGEGAPGVIRSVSDVEGEAPG